MVTGLLSFDSRASLEILSKNVQGLSCSGDLVPGASLETPSTKGGGLCRLIRGGFA